MGSKLPMALVHIRIASPADIRLTEKLRDAIRAAVAQHVEVYGVRIKRRKMPRADFDKLFAVYEER